MTTALPDPFSYGPTRKISVRDINLLLEREPTEEGVVWLDSDLLVEIDDATFYAPPPPKRPPPLPPRRTPP